MKGYGLADKARAIPFTPDTIMNIGSISKTFTGAVYEAAYHYGGDSPEPLGDSLKSYFVSGGKRYSKDNFVDAKPGTRREYSRIGHGGSDPGVRTMMLSDLPRQVGVILFANTSLCDEGMGPYGIIFNALWDHAMNLKDGATGH